MSIMHFDTTTSVSKQIQASLLGGFANDFDITYATAGFYFNTNGFSYRLEGGGSSLINSATDWIEPRDTFTTADWQVRGTYISYLAIGSGVDQIGNALVPLPVGTVGSWYALNIGRDFEWRAQTTTYGAIRGATLSFNCEIRNSVETNYNTLTSVEDGAAIAASGTYNVYIEALTLN